MSDFMKDKNGEPLIVLGKKYRHTVHDIEGVATCVSRHITGCDRVCLERLMPDGKVSDLWADITLIEGLDIPEAEHKPGGPQSAPPALSGEG